MKEPRNEQTNGWVSYFFVELPLHWATSLLRYLSPTPSLSSVLSELLLLQPASALSCLPLSAMSSCSFCNPSLLFEQPTGCILQPPAAIANRGGVAASPTLSFVQRCRCVLSHPASIRHKSITPKRPTCAQRWHWGRFHTIPRISLVKRFSGKSSSFYSLVHIFSASSSTSARRPSVV